MSEFANVPLESFRFYKGHALGNDYIVLDPKHFTPVLTENRIKLICDRHFGLGSDGILYGPHFESSRPRLVIYNPDGSEAQKSGNGIRIFSKYLYDAGYVTDDSFELETKGGLVTVKRKTPDATLLEVSMGKLTFFSTSIPVAGAAREVLREPIVVGNTTYEMNCASIGNPHCVFVMDTISQKLAEELGPTIENHPMFPERTNVQFVKVRDRNNIEIEIWERGAGYTLASGSSSSAAAGVCHKLGLCDNSITVHMPGGEIAISIDNQFKVTMTGLTARVAEGELSRELVGSPSHGTQLAPMLLPR
jgi:diaminopimelate epimerase